jgi:4'-phosphopantetheinyl transferase
MVEVIYSNINQLEDYKINLYLQFLPEAMRKEILRNKLIESQKAKLISRLMLIEQLNVSESGLSLEDWYLSNTNKPFIKSWNNFNISHSGDFVILCHSKFQVGIDIERVEYLNDLLSLTNFFSEDEKKFVLDSIEPNAAFYEIWVKKEAYLKAIGMGLSIKLDSFSCLGEMINFDNMLFFFKQIFIHPRYVCYLSSSLPNTSISLKQFHLKDYSAFLV